MTDEHYFTATPAAASRRSTVSLVLPDISLQLATDAGVFSAAAVDPGTKLLLTETIETPSGAVHLLDLGCGYGPVAVTLARRAPEAQVWAIDVNERARALTEENAEAAGVADRVRVCAPDDVPSDVVFAAIWSNPPIRIGKAPLHQLLARWLARLEPATGRAYLVAQKHLGSDSLARWLAEQGYAVERRRSRVGYRVLEVSPS
jgi:16S rRNA (guanine1207-N2)-methyltransferase